MATYSELQELVRDWSNRDSTALPLSVISRCINWGADKAYNTLRVPPLQTFTTYTDETALLDATDGHITILNSPPQLLEIESIRVYDSEGLTLRMYNLKTDYQTFMDPYRVFNGTEGVWTQHGDFIYMTPQWGYDGNAAGIEICYYQRLLEPSATYEVTAANLNNLSQDDLSTYYTEITDTAYTALTSTEQADYTHMQKGEYSDGTTTAYYYYAGGATIDTNATITGTDGNTYSYVDVADVYVLGLEAPNWLRDENEKVLIYGALAEVYSYLGEVESMQRYSMLFEQELAMLNKRYADLEWSNGHVRVQYSSPLL